MSILPASLRLTALRQASDYFDHRDRAQHDLELREGAAAVLYQKLAFAIYQAGGLMDSLAGLDLGQQTQEAEGVGDEQVLVGQNNSAGKSDLVVAAAVSQSLSNDYDIDPSSSSLPFPSKRGAFETEFPNLDDSSTSTASVCT